MMLSTQLKNQIARDDSTFKMGDPKEFRLPSYDPKTHYIELTRSKYFQALIVLRNYIKASSDFYFGTKRGAQNIDLFMLTPSISSPMGPGSDSEAIPIKFGKYASNLVDSSQFGFEPLLLNGFDEVYCYLPSMRGEKPDKRHINQFFHCEAEIRGELDTLIPVIEGYVKTLAETVFAMPHIVQKISLDPKKTNAALQTLVDAKSFPSITFDEAISALVENGHKKMVNFTPYGRDISSEGELMVAKLYKFKTPFWIRNYDRDRVAFYQKPVPGNTDAVINADLIFPPIIDGAFGGEIVGCGQRQDDPKEMDESLSRQKVSKAPYEWYIDLRKDPRYSTTSGFGLGIERFITWSLCRDDIKDVILYPRLKNVKTLP